MHCRLLTRRHIYQFADITDPTKINSWFQSNRTPDWFVPRAAIAN